MNQTGRPPNLRIIQIIDAKTKPLWSITELSFMNRYNLNIQSYHHAATLGLYSDGFDTINDCWFTGYTIDKYSIDIILDIIKEVGNLSEHFSSRI